MGEDHTFKTTGRAEARLIIAASEADANLFYATRFLAPDPFVFLWHGDTKILLMSDLELDRARTQAAVDSVLPMRQYEERAKASGIERPTQADALWELLQDRQVKSALVPGDFPVEHADRLRQRGVTLVVKSEPFFEERLVKSPAEVQAITAALRHTEARESPAWRGDRGRSVAAESARPTRSPRGAAAGR